MAKPKMVVACGLAAVLAFLWGGPQTVAAPGDEVPQCADLDRDGVVTLTDAVHLLRALFAGTGDLGDGAAGRGDLDSNGAVNLSDAVRLLRWLFQSGPPPVCDTAPAIDGFRFLRLNPRGYPEYEHERTGLVFVRLPGGTFTMGSPEDECERGIFEEQHEVELRPFLIAKYEVSQAVWESVMGSNPAAPAMRGPDLPVEPLSWIDCKAFAARTGLGLPSEAQWEYACRAGTTTPFFFGETIRSDQANFRGDVPYCDGEPGLYRRTLVPIDSFEPNAFGLHNMHGNSLEWCEDDYDDFYRTPEARGPDPVARTGSIYRVLRGGCWYDKGLDCRSAARYFGLPSETRVLSGYRPAVSLPDTGRSP